MAAYPPPQYPGAAGGPPQRWQPGQGAPPPEWNNTSEQLIVDNENAREEAGPNFNSGNLPQYNGYGQIGSEFSPCPPPPPPSQLSGKPPDMNFGDTSDLSVEDCRDAMLQFVAENCCYGAGTAKEMQITDTRSSKALHYILETYCEARQTAYVHEPYRGQPISGADTGIPPGPWMIPCDPNKLFLNHVKKIPVPHTSVIKPCYRCNSCGFVRCGRCHGRGQVRCGSCGGDGRVRRVDHEGHSYQASCTSCGGDGRRRCFRCGGDGRVTCPECEGFCQLHMYVQLKVSYTNNVEDFIKEDTDMPDELVRDVTGDLLFEQTLPLVWPIQHFADPNVAQASVSLCNKHRSAWPNCRLLHQRQRLDAKPVTEVDAHWKEWKSRFWVYGRERKVHSPDYPQTCCWGCNIL